MKHLTAILIIPLLVLGTSGCIVETDVEVEDLPAGTGSVYTFDLIFSMDDASFNGPVASVPFDVPEIDAWTVAEGAVLVFFRDQGTWTALPYTFGVESPDLPAVDYTIAMGYGYEVGVLEAFYEASTEAVALENLPDRQLRVVIIEAFPYGKRAVDLTDWEAVKAHFGLRD
jgi:hypothetical protein